MPVQTPNDLESKTALCLDSPNRVHWSNFGFAFGERSNERGELLNRRLGSNKPDARLIKMVAFRGGNEAVAINHTAPEMFGAGQFEDGSGKRLSLGNAKFREFRPDAFGINRDSREFIVIFAKPAVAIINVQRPIRAEKLLETLNHDSVIVGKPNGQTWRVLAGGNTPVGHDEADEVSSRGIRFGVVESRFVKAVVSRPAARRQSSGYSLMMPTDRVANRLRVDPQRTSNRSDFLAILNTSCEIGFSGRSKKW